MWKKRLKETGTLFCMITTGSTVSAALLTTFTKPTEIIFPNVIWQLLFCSFLCSLTPLLYPPGRTFPKREMIIRTLLHYVLINLIVLGCGLGFDWFEITHIPSVLFMLLSIAIIFGIALFMSWRRSVLEAQKMNEKLQEHFQIQEDDKN